MHWIEHLEAALATHGRAVLVTVAHVAGSTPREPGASMVVTADAIAGTIGGGHLEFESTRIAREALARDDVEASAWLVRFPLAARLGQCCGGVATIALAVIDGRGRDCVAAARASLRDGEPFACVTRIGDGARLVATARDVVGSLGDPALDAAATGAARARLDASPGTPAATTAVQELGAASLLVHVVHPDAFDVVLFGNGHVGRALVQVLGTLPARVRWVDERGHDFPAAVPGNVEVVATDLPVEEIEGAPRRAFVVVMTHSHALDFDLVAAALRRRDWRYLGLIGSKSKRAQFERRLLARGVDGGALRRLTCPIGAGAIRSKEPGAIAIAVAAEILAVRDRADAAGREEADAARR